MASQDGGRREVPDAHSDQPDGETKLPIGEFGSAREGGTFRVSWAPATGNVYADPVSSTATPPSGAGQRLLARLPDVAYVQATISAIDEARGTADWRTADGLELLARWMARVAAGLRGAVEHAPADDVVQPFYVDLGHDRRLVDAHRADLLAQELWDGLDDMLGGAREALDDLDTTLAGDGNLARAARDAQQLADVAVSLHIALADGYRAAHERSVGPHPPSGG